MYFGPADCSEHELVARWGVAGTVGGRLGRSLGGKVGCVSRAEAARVAAAWVAAAEVGAAEVAVAGAVVAAAARARPTPNPSISLAADLLWASPCF